MGILDKVVNPEKIIDEEAFASAFVDGISDLLRSGITVRGQIGGVQVLVEIWSTPSVPTTAFQPTQIK